MVSVGDKALLFRNRDMAWLEESGSPSVGDKGFLVRTDNGNFFLKETSVSVGSKGRLFNINNQYYLRSDIAPLVRFKWRVNCSNKIHGIKITSDGTIFAGTEWGTTNGAIWGINSNGGVKWCNHDPYNATLCPTCYYDFKADIVISSDETRLFTGDLGDWIRGFNTNNGTEIWNWSQDTGPIYGGLVIDAGDNVYAGTSDDKIVSLDKNGNLRWINTSVYEPEYHLALDDNQIYVPSKYLNRYCAIDLTSGNINWTAGLKSGFAVEYYNNRAYYGTYNELDCVTTGGGLIYRYTIDDYVEDITIDPNDNCYFFENRNNNSNCIKKLDSDGNLIWTTNMSNAHCVRFGPHAIIADSSNLYVATDTWWASGKAAFSIKLSDGSINWSYPLTYDSKSSGAFSPSKDTFYFGSGQYLYALNV